MKHFALPSFWKHYNNLPEQIQKLADKKFRLLKENPYHPSLHFKKITNKEKSIWSVRIGLHYRALGMDKPKGVKWFWIGTHGNYDKILS